MVEIIAPGSFRIRAPEIKPPNKEVSRYPLPITLKEPGEQRRKESAPKREVWASELMKKRLQKHEKVTTYEIGLSEEDIKKLEEAARQVGLEVPEVLKQKKVVSAEEKDRALAEFQNTLNSFIGQLKHEYERRKYEEELMKLRGIAEGYQRRHPGVSVFVNDAGFVAVVNSVVRDLNVETNEISNEDQMMKEARAGKLLEYNKKDNPYAGYEEYYKGLRKLREELNLPSIESDKIVVDVNPSDFSHPRARARGLNANVEIDLMSTKELDQETQKSVQPIKLYSDQTKTWEDIQREQDALSEVYTASGLLTEKLLNIEYEPDDNSAERFLKGVPRGVAGFFLFPVDVAMMAAQWDKIKRAAELEEMSTKEFLLKSVKESLKDPGTWGEITGSILASIGTSAFLRATRPVVYEKPGGLSGYRQIMQEIMVDEEDIARAIRTEAFDYDELTRITIEKNWLGKPRKVTVEKIPQKFSARAYESITIKNNIMAVTRELDVPLTGDVNLGNVKISQFASAGDDMMRFVKTNTKTLVSTDDIMNFLQKAKEGGDAPTELIKTISYSTDDAMRITLTKEIYDDIAKIYIETKNFQDDIIRGIKQGGKKGAETSLDDIIRGLNPDETNIVTPAGGSGRAGGQLLQLLQVDDTLKQVDDVAFKITEKTGERVMVPQGDVIIPPVGLPDININIDKEVRDIWEGTDNINDYINKGGQKGKGRLDEDTDIDIDIDKEVRMIVLESQKSMEDINIKPGISEITRTVTKIKTTTSPTFSEDIDFNIRDLTDDLVKLEQDVRQLYTALMEPEPPKPKHTKPKFKKEPPRLRLEEKKPKKKTKKKSRKKKGGEWAEWIGYESFLDL